MPRQSDVRYTFEPFKADAFDVVSFKLQEGLSQPFKLELDLASHNAAIDFNRVLDLAGLFMIWRGETPVRYVHGMVSLFTQADTGFRRTRYSVVLETTLKRFELRSNWRIFQGKNVPDIRIGGNVEHYIKSHYRLAAGEGIAQKTTVFEVAADERIVLKAPGGSITIDGDGITLDGLTIKIKGPVTVDTIGSGNPFASQRRSPIPPPDPIIG